MIAEYEKNKAIEKEIKVHKYCNKESILNEVKLNKKPGKNKNL